MKVTVLHLVPPIVLRLAKNTSSSSLLDECVSVRGIVTAGAPLSEGTKCEFKQRFPRISICDGERESNNHSSPILPSVHVNFFCLQA